MNPEFNGLREYLSILRRRKWSFAAVTGAVLLLGAAVVLRMPDIYQATSMILIERQEIPEKLVQSVDTTYADQRIQVIARRVMTRDNLLRLITTHDLYPDLRDSEGTSTILEHMRRDISLDMVSESILDPNTGRSGKATIAFNLSYEHTSPDTALAVTNDLTALVLAANEESRIATALEASAFLAQETERARAEVEETAQEMGEFREQYTNLLPEMTAANLQQLQRLELELVELDGDLRTLHEREALLQAELSRVGRNAVLYGEDGERVLGPEDRLRILRAEFVEKSARYSPNHPDLVKLRREIDALETQASGAVDTSALELKIRELDANLVQLNQQYSRDHPTVRDTERSLEALRAQLDRTRHLSARPAASSRPDNPAYIQVSSQLSGVRAEMAELRKTKSNMEARLGDYEVRISQAPAVDKQLAELKLEYEARLRDYESMAARKMEAELSAALEESRQGEQLSLLEVPIKPDRPIRPNRPLLLFAICLTALVFGIAIVALRELFDDSVHTGRDVGKLLGEGPLAVIPHLTATRGQVRTAT